MGDRDYFRKDYPFGKKNIFQPGFDNAIVSVIIINLIVYTILFGLWLIYLVTFDTEAAAQAPFADQITGNLFLPAEPSEFITKPWTLLSYMFTQFSFWRLFSNMLWLWAFGQIFQSIAGSDKIFPVYIYSGLVGGIFFVLSTAVLNNSLAAQMIGPGTAVVGLAIAATAISPDYRLFPMLGNGIPLWILTAIFIIIDLASVSISSNTTIAHVAAGLTGYGYVVLLRKGNDTGAWMHRFGNWFMDLFNPEKKHGNNTKQTLFYKAKKEPFSRKPNLTQQKLDELLDKINQKGYDSLSDDEKDFLKKASERL